MISVCITTYNGARYIKEQLNSILPQLAENDEVIISDDGSTDDTLAIIDKIGDSRICVLQHQKSNKSVSFSFQYVTMNFENALLRAKGDLIFLADQDDIWQCDKVERIKFLFSDNLNKSLILHDCVLIDGDGNKVGDSYFRINSSKPGFWNNMYNSSYLGCCMVFRRELLSQALPFPKNPVPHDLWIGLIAEYNRQALFVDEEMLLYRRHDANESTSGGKSNFSFKTKLSYRFILLIELLRRLIFGH